MEEIENEPSNQTLGYRFGKMIVATAVTFVATALAEKAYDAVVEKRRNK